MFCYILLVCFYSELVVLWAGSSLFLPNSGPYEEGVPKVEFY